MDGGRAAAQVVRGPAQALVSESFGWNGDDWLRSKGCLLGGTVFLDASAPPSLTTDWQNPPRLKPFATPPPQVCAVQGAERAADGGVLVQALQRADAGAVPQDHGE